MHKLGNKHLTWVRARARENLAATSRVDARARANLVSTHPTCTPTRLTDRTDPKHSKQDKKTTLTDITNDPNLCGKPYDNPVILKVYFVS